MIQLGKIVYKIKHTNLYIVHIGLGLLKICKTNEHLEEDEVIVYQDDYYYSNPCEYLYIEFNDRLSNYILGDDVPVNTKWPDKVINRISYTKRFEIVGMFYDGMRQEYAWEKFKLNQASTCLLYSTLFKRKNIYPSEIDLLEIFSDAKNYVESLDLPKIISQLKVEVCNSGYTHRGYYYSWTYIKSSYDFYDKFLESMFPTINIGLSSYDEKEDERRLSKEYPDKNKWPEIAKQKEKELKEKAMDILQNNYSKEVHTIHIVYEKMERLYYNYCEENKKLISGASEENVYWVGFDFKKTIKAIESCPEKLEEILCMHNSSLSLIDFLRE